MVETNNPNGRWYPSHPFIGVGALIVKDGRYLLIKRGKEPSKGKWSIPGGKVELGETLVEAVKREVLEECGIQIEIIKIFNVMDRILKDENGRTKYHFVLIDYYAQYISGEARALSDADDMKWVTAEEIVNLDMNPKSREIILGEIAKK